MSIDAGTLVAAGGMVIGAIVWLVRLEGRINVTEAQFAEILRRLDRIESRMDAK